jgi:hypothetical protein
MGKLYESISPELKQCLVRQPIFFVATAPNAGDAHINCSLKGGEQVSIVGRKTAR